MTGGSDICKNTCMKRTAARSPVAIRRTCMHERFSIGVLTLATALLTAGPTSAFDATKYPDFVGVWHRATPGEPRFDPSKPPGGRAQQAPLKPQYQAEFEVLLKDIAEGGKGELPAFTCLAPGMPMIMTAHEPMEIVILPEVTYIMIDHIYESVRRVFTDDRPFPNDAEPSFVGYSIGKWLDTDGDGKYDVLEVETRNLKGPRVYDESGLMLHPDNMSVITERIYLDKSDKDLLHDELTVIDNALTRPWMVKKTYRRETTKRLVWREEVCAEVNQHVRIGKEFYKLDVNGYLMPTKKDQAPPDLQHFRN
jgi:hypothetical protein